MTALQITRATLVRTLECRRQANRALLAGWLLGLRTREEVLASVRETERLIELIQLRRGN